MQKKSMFYFVVLGLLTAPNIADAGIRVGNSSRSNAQGYQQVNTLRYQNSPEYQAAVAAAAVPAELPITVTDAQLAEQIKSGDTNASTNMTNLQTCSMIYPNGEFAWTQPNIGTKASGPQTCVAVIEMRAANAGKDGSDLTFARAYLAAGDAIKCNIDSFPAHTQILTDVPEDFTVPADTEPTIEDVKSQMNKEQKQNAVFKIASKAIVGALAGNVYGDSAPGSDSMLGTNKDKLKTTAFGALGGAAIGAGSVYGGKVGGDMIESIGTNALAGSFIGNMAASGDSVLRIESCSRTLAEKTKNEKGEEVETGTKEDKKCLWGYIEKKGNLEANQTAYVNRTDIGNFIVCEEKEGPNGAKETTCGSKNLTDIELKGYTDKNKSKDETQKQDLTDALADKFNQIGNFFCYENGKMKDGQCQDSDNKTYVKLDGASIVTNTQPALIWDVEDRGRGWKSKDWQKYKTDLKNPKIYKRTGNGEIGGEFSDEEGKIENFKPAYLDAEDGGVLDMKSSARLKNTLTGAGVGGAMGGFTAYQGAQNEIQERWLAEVRAYKDSLSKVYCATGQRFLSQYNDMVAIPALTTE